MLANADTVRSPELMLYSNADPGPAGERLSRADSLCIAVAERLELPLVGDGEYWRDLPLPVKFHPLRSAPGSAATLIRSRRHVRRPITDNKPPNIMELPRTKRAISADNWLSS